MGDEADEDANRAVFAAVGERIMVLRRRAKLTQTELAQRAGMSKPYIVVVENHGANLSLNALCRLARALGTEPGNLFPRTRVDPLDSVRASDG